MLLLDDIDMLDRLDRLALGSTRLMRKLLTAMPL